MRQSDPTAFGDDLFQRPTGHFAGELTRKEKKMPKLLEEVRTVVVPATKVRPSMLRDGVIEGVKVSLMVQAQEVLREHEEIIEAPRSKVLISSISRDSKVYTVFNTLGYESARISFASVWGMVLGQPEGQEGDLGIFKPNLFTPREFPGWVFYWEQYQKGWHLGITAHTFVLAKESQVLSR